MRGQAGTLESNDIVITVADGENGIEIELESIVMTQFGRQIREAIISAVKDKGIENLYVKAIDRGAIDSTIRARVYAAIERARAEEKS